MAQDFVSAERVKSGGILDVFPAFNPARMGQKIRHPAAADLFSGSQGHYLIQAVQNGYGQLGAVPIFQDFLLRN